MKDTAAYNHFIVIALVMLLAGLIQPVIARAAVKTQMADPVKMLPAGPDSLSLEDCQKQKAEVAAESTQVTSQIVESGQTTEAGEPATVSKAKKEEERSAPSSNNISFNFLYYLFYKFSVHDFFKVPDYNKSIE